MADIAWREEFDEHDNSIWEGPSPYTPHEDDPPFVWRLQLRLVGNNPQWYAIHDHELGGETGDTWETIEEAKAACYEAHNRIISDEITWDSEYGAG